MNNSHLAINGGTPAIDFELAGRHHFGEAEKEAVNKLFDEAILSGYAPGYNGPYEEKYCQEFAEFMGGGYADAVNSGTNSVYVALRAINPEPFTEIIVGCVTDPGGMMPIALINCIPIVADAAPGCYNSGPQQIEEKITPLTSAIVIAHIGGEPADIKGIMKVAKKHNLPVIEDCSQSHGAKVDGKYVGTFGDIAAFSTMFGKHHCTGGQGGVVFTKKEELYLAARRAADRGKPFGLTGATNCIAALNCNLSDLGGVLGSVQLKKLPDIISKRQDFVKKLTPYFSKLKSISIPDVVPGGEHTYWWWRLEVNVDNIKCSKDEFCKALQAEGVSMNPSYKAALPHLMDWFKNKTVFGSSDFPWGCSLYKGDPNQDFPCPNALAAIDCQFNLTIHESWRDKEADAIIKAFQKVEEAYVKY